MNARPKKPHNMDPLTNRGDGSPRVLVRFGRPEHAALVKYAAKLKMPKTTAAHEIIVAHLRRSGELSA